MPRKKLLLVINHMDWFWSHRLPLAVGAQKDGWQVDVAAAGSSTDQKLSDHGFQGFELPDFAQGFGPFNLLKSIFRLRALIKRENPDIVHAITLKYAFIAGLAARSIPDTKIVHTIAGLGYLFSGYGFKPKLLRTLIGPFLKYALKGSNIRLIFQNPDDQALMLSSGFANPDQCHLIMGSGVDLKEFPYNPEPENKIPLVMMPTRLVHDKGIAIFIEAAHILKNKGLDANFQIAGGISTSNPLAIKEEEMKEMVKDGVVTWLGKVSDMPGLLSNCNLIVYPSYYREGIPKVLLESCACGRAIVTTDHPGCREAVKHGHNGFLVPIKDPKATADAIETLLTDPEKRKDMGKKSRNHAVKKFDVTKIVDMSLAVYQDF